MTRSPFFRDSAPFSARSRQQLTLRNVVSSCWLPARSVNRRLEATRNEATGAPDCVKRRSGSSVRFPMKVMKLDSNAMVQAFLVVDVARTGRRGRTGSRDGDLGRADPDLGTDGLEARDVVGDLELSLEFTDRLCGRLEVEDAVETVITLVDLVGELALAPPGFLKQVPTLVGQD